jgi:hypothetical protein
MISRILQLEPEKRLKVSEILAHPFMNPTDYIPPLLMPQSTLACPPSKAFLQQISAIEIAKGSSTFRQEGPKSDDASSSKASSVLVSAVLHQPTPTMQNKDELKS